MESIAVILNILGGALYLVGWIWGVVLGFQKGGALWGILNILIPVLPPLIMAIQKKIKWMPVILQVIGIILPFAVLPIVLIASGTAPQ